MVPPTNANRLYVTGGNGIYVSSDAGASWEHWSDRSADIGGYPDQLVYLPSNPNIMFVCAAHKEPGAWREHNRSGSRISRSRDGGRTWEVLTNGLPDRMQGSVESMCFDTHGDGGTLLVGTSTGEVWVSENYSATRGQSPSTAWPRSPRAITIGQWYRRWRKFPVFRSSLRVAGPPFLMSVHPSHSYALRTQKTA